jgi:hypothetical protein
MDPTALRILAEQQALAPLAAHAAAHQALTQTAGHLTSLTAGLDAIDVAMADLSGRYRAVATRTAELRDACESVLQQKAALLATADTLRARLILFDHADRLAMQISAVPVHAATAATGTLILGDKTLAAPDVPIPLPSTTPEEFIVVFQRIDECLAFLALNVRVLYSRF